MDNSSSILIVFCWFFLCIALGDTDLSFSLTSIPKANADEGGITQAVYMK